MHIFYTPDIQNSPELPEEETAHAVRVLRLQPGDEVMLTDGMGNFYRARISLIAHKRCLVDIDRSPTPIVERTPAHRHGPHQEHGSHGMVCRESHGDRH